MSEVFAAEIQQKIHNAGVVAVLIIDDAANAVPLAETLLAGGVTAMELTLRTAAAIPALKAIRKHVPQMLAGIGTILTPDQVEEVVNAGAQFGVAPGFNSRVVDKAKRFGLSFAPGIMTPSDIEHAVELGCRLLKFFPAETSGGLAHLQSIAAPYAHLNLRYIPLGGLNADNMHSYVQSPLVAGIGGSWLATRLEIANKDWDTIRAKATAVTQRIRDLRASA